MVGFEEAEIRGFNLFLSLIGLRIAEFRSRDTEIIPRLPELWKKVAGDDEVTKCSQVNFRKVSQCCLLVDMSSLIPLTSPSNVTIVIPYPFLLLHPKSHIGRVWTRPPS